MMCFKLGTSDISQPLEILNWSSMRNWIHSASLNLSPWIESLTLEPSYEMIAGRLGKGFPDHRNLLSIADLPTARELPYSHT